jgi:hypothetical protein
MRPWHTSTREVSCDSLFVAMVILPAGFASETASTGGMFVWVRGQARSYGRLSTSAPSFWGGIRSALLRPSIKAPLLAT